MSPIPFAIRKARSDDAQKLSQLAFHSKEYWGYNHDFMEACRPELTYTPMDINDSKCCFYLAVGAMSLIGFYGLEQRSFQHMELIALFVAPPFIGQGYGRVLIDHARAQARFGGAKILMIQSDPNAEAFYRAVGAYRIGQEESDSIPGRYLPLYAVDL